MAARAPSHMENAYEDDLADGVRLNRIGEASADYQHKGMEDLRADSQDYFDHNTLDAYD